MQVDEVTEGRVLRKRKEKIPKHLKREANAKEMDETKETEEDIRRMFHYIRERMKLRITLKKKSDPGKFAIPYDDFWQVVKHEKLGEGDFEVESSMSFGGSHWCRPMSIDAHRSTDHDEDRSIDYS
ncbi:hypothetical protein DY000_02007907 [Brassica cretica]|uniref:Uncharacterized protein n=1 Tax=Brassica cretica TaxID=69181 RepID=A0ABQ7CB59_BRACR|nr:hypothetical protein DY000_02007907 [Brassica cretica]